MLYFVVMTGLEIVCEEMRQVCGSCYDDIHWHDQGVGDVLEFEENCDRDAGGARSWCPYFPATVVFIRCADDIAFGAVLGK